MTASRGSILGLPRPAYEVGRPLSHADRASEQHYLLQKFRRHNRHLHGWGVVCGLMVVPAGDPRRPWALYVCPGYALGPYGDEILVPMRVTIDVHDYLWLLPPGIHPRLAHVAIRYAEDLVRPTPAPPVGCGCNDTVYEPSCVRDGFQVDVLWELEQTPARDGVDICAPRPVPCPECPPSPYVWLACVTLPASESHLLTGDRIDNTACRSR